MIDTLMRYNRGYTRQFLIYLGAGGIVLLLFLALYLSAMSAVTPTRAPIGSASSSDASSRTIRLAGQDISVTVADTDAEREKGLGGKDGLAPREGMLFIFGADGFYGFWMRDMAFSIDILWLAADGAVVHIEHAVSPDTYPRSYASGSPARYVLELPAGWSQEYNVKVGDVAQF